MLKKVVKLVFSWEKIISRFQSSKRNPVLSNTVYETPMGGGGVEGGQTPDPFLIVKLNYKEFVQNMIRSYI